MFVRRSRPCYWAHYSTPWQQRKQQRSCLMPGRDLRKHERRSRPPKRKYFPAREKLLSQNCSCGRGCQIIQACNQMASRHHLADIPRQYLEESVGSVAPRAAASLLTGGHGQPLASRSRPSCTTKKNLIISTAKRCSYNHPAQRFPSNPIPIQPT